jgi:hypothetical protein
VAWPLACGNVALLAVSVLILLRHPERRHLGDLIAGTRVVRVPAPGPRQVAKMPKPDRIVLFALNTLFIFCLFIGPWVGCHLWLHSLRTEHEAKVAQAIKEMIENYNNRLLTYKEQLVAAGVSPTEVRLRILGWTYRSAVTSKWIPQGPRDLGRLLSREELKSPRTGEEFVILWGTPLSLSPEKDAGALLAFEPTPDGEGKRYVLLGDNQTRQVTEEQFQRLRHAAQHEAHREGLVGGQDSRHAHLLLQQYVRKELKLSADQIKKVEELHENMRKKVEEVFKLKGDEGRKMQQDLIENLKALAGILKPEQAKRLKQISYQRQGEWAFTDGEVAKALQLTDTQKKEIQKIIEDHATQMRHLFQPRAPGDEETRKKMTALRTVFQEKLMKLLTNEQRTKWKDLQGAPFEMRSVSNFPSDKP